MSSLAQNIPGLTVAMMDDGEMVWSKGFGYSSRREKASPTVRHSALLAKFQIHRQASG